MSSGPSTPSGSDSKRQRVLPVPKAAANMRTFEPDSSIVSDIIPSPNHGDRNKGRQPDMILLHYTGMPDVEGALARLCTAGTEVSAHYVVLEDGRIVQCVPEAKRAWHAGVSSWAGEDDINSCSIGIEIINRGHDWGYPEYPLRQIAAVITLCRGIMLRRKVAGAPGARPFRRRAGAQEGSRREISVAFAGQFRRRTLGHARADRARREPDARHHQRRGAEPAAGARPIRLRRAADRQIRRRDDGSRHRLPAPFPPARGSMVSRITRRCRHCRRCWRACWRMRRQSRRSNGASSLRAQRSNPDCLRGNSLDCFVASPSQ